MPSAGVTYRDIDTHRALYHASRIWFGRGLRGRSLTTQHRTGTLRYGGRAVTMASRHAPYAVSRHGLGRVQHHVRAVLFAWRRGQLAGMLVICWCGAQLVTAELVDQVLGGVAACGLCQVRTGTTTRIQVIVAVGHG